jgi:hypothetical protein
MDAARMSGSPSREEVGDFGRMGKYEFLGNRPLPTVKAARAMWRL